MPRGALHAFAAIGKVLPLALIRVPRFNRVLVKSTSLNESFSILPTSSAFGAIPNHFVRGDGRGHPGSFLPMPSLFGLSLPRWRSSEILVFLHASALRIDRPILSTLVPTRPHIDLQYARGQDGIPA